MEKKKSFCLCVAHDLATRLPLFEIKAKKKLGRSNTRVAERESLAVNHENCYCSRKNLKENAQSEIIEMRKQPRAVELSLQFSHLPAGSAANKVYAR
jgi:hypothetical protein